MKKLVETLPVGVSNIYGIAEGGGGLFNLYPEDVLRKPGSIGLQIWPKFSPRATGL